MGGQPPAHVALTHARLFLALLSASLLFLPPFALPRAALSEEEAVPPGKMLLYVTPRISHGHAPPTRSCSLPTPHKLPSSAITPATHRRPLTAACVLTRAHTGPTTQEAQAGYAHAPSSNLKPGMRECSWERRH